MSDLKRVYAAPTEAIALSELDLFDGKWGGKYPKIAKSWKDNWANVSSAILRNNKFNIDHENLDILWDNLCDNYKFYSVWKY